MAVTWAAAPSWHRPSPSLSLGRGDGDTVFTSSLSRPARWIRVQCQARLHGVGRPPVSGRTDGHTSSVSRQGMAPTSSSSLRAVLAAVRTRLAAVSAIATQGDHHYLCSNRWPLCIFMVQCVCCTLAMPIYGSSSCHCCVQNRNVLVVFQVSMRPPVRCSGTFAEPSVTM